MRDITSVSRITALHPKARDTFKKFIETAEDTLDITIRVVQGLRTFEEQDAIYQQGRTKPGKIVSNARAGSSFHNYGLAVDLGILEKGQINWEFDYSRLLPFMPPEMKWGGSFKKIVDKPHFEISYGRAWLELLGMYNKGNFIPGTKYVNI